MAIETLDIPGSPLGGGDLIAKLEAVLASLASSRKGNARPADVQAGEIWIDDNNDPVWYLKLWDGDADVVLYRVDASTDTAYVPVSAGGTGATTPAAALTALGAEPAITKLSGFNLGLSTQGQAEEAAINTALMTPQRTAQLIAARIVSQAAAEAGTDNTKLMTPLRTHQAIMVKLADLDAGADLYFGNSEIFTASGTFTVPADVTEIIAEVIGGGGGSGNTGQVSDTLQGEAGGASPLVRVKITNLTPGESLSISVGAAGTGGVFGNPGTQSTPGGTSSVGSYVSVTGGKGGQYATPGRAKAGDYSLASVDVELLNVWFPESYLDGEVIVLNSDNKGVSSPLGRGGEPLNDGEGWGAGAGSPNGGYQAQAGYDGAPGLVRIFWT